MKKSLATVAVIVLIAVGVQARGEEHAATAPEDAPLVPKQPFASGDWTTPLGDPVKTAPVEPVEENQSLFTQIDAAELDVIDAHWMALTMWGEARSHGETGMRAVGHVIHNRKVEGRFGAYVTDTVSKAYQFSCWNEGDPNRAAMLNIESLPRDSRDYAMWLAAKRIASEIMSGRSPDITGGALFYHTTAVAPKWSRGVEPVRQIGSHLFFVNAR